MEDRIIVLTENMIFKLNSSYKEMKSIPLNKVEIRLLCIIFYRVLLRMCGMKDPLFFGLNWIYCEEDGYLVLPILGL